MEKEDFKFVIENSNKQKIRIFFSSLIIFLIIIGLGLLVTPIIFLFFYDISNSGDGYMAAPFILLGAGAISSPLIYDTFKPHENNVVELMTPTFNHLFTKQTTFNIHITSKETLMILLKNIS